MTDAKINDKNSLVMFIRELGKFCKTQKGYIFLLKLLFQHYNKFGDEIFEELSLVESDEVVTKEGMSIGVLVFNGIGIFDKEQYSLVIKDKSISEEYLSDVFFLTRNLIKLTRNTKGYFIKDFLTEAAFTELKNLMLVN